MNVKIDTKEKFTVITPNEPMLSANMTDDLSDLLLPYLQKDIPHIVFNMKMIQTVDEIICEKLVSLQQEFYENDHSFVICEINKNIEALLDKLELLEIMNITPTESEAWDILQMEEVEREMMNDEF